MTEPVGTGSISVLVTGSSAAFPYAVALDGSLVCGELVDHPAGPRPCPGDILGGQAKVTLPLQVEPGTHVLSTYEKRQGSGSAFEDVEDVRFEFAADAAQSYICDLDRESCAARESTDTEPKPEVECYLNSDCDLGLQCISGRCVPLCREDRDCAAPRRCIESDAGYLDCVEP